MIRSLLMSVATPFYVTVLVFATVVTLYCIIVLARTRGQVPSTRLGRWIAALPFIAGLIPFAIFLENVGFTYYFMFFDDLFRATGDPRVHSTVISDDFMFNVISLAVFIFFLSVWLVLREWYRRRMVTAV